MKSADRWKQMEKQAAHLKKTVKTFGALDSFLSEWPEEGFFVDPNSKETVKLAECKASTLRRFDRLLERYLKYTTSSQELLKLQKKKKEVENALTEKYKEEI